mgnify:FL=1
MCWQMRKKLWLNWLMSNIINFQEQKRVVEYRRIAELFNVVMFIGTNDEYEIDMECNEDYDALAVFNGLEVLYAKFGIEHGFLGDADDQEEDK